MGLINKVVFDDIDSSDYDVYIAGDGAYNAPARRGEMITIPGRNGTLFMDEDAFENIEVSYPAFIGEFDESTFSTKLRNYRSALSSKKTYARISDTYHPDEFRLGVFHSGLEAEPKQYMRAGEFSIVFDCKPQRFLTSGEIERTYTAASNTLTNPTDFDALPLMKITGNGTITIGNYQVAVSGNLGTFWLDCELMEAYIPADDIQLWTDQYGDIMLDEHGFYLEFANGYVYPASVLQYVVFANHEFPRIVPGLNAVDLDGITELVVIPRWWML